VGGTRFASVPFHERGSVALTRERFAKRLVIARSQPRSDSEIPGKQMSSFTKFFLKNFRGVKGGKVPPCQEFQEGEVPLCRGALGGKVPPGLGSPGGEAPLVITPGKHQNRQVGSELCSNGS